MNQELDFDCLVVGQGLAGSILSWLLHKHGQRVLVVDRGSKESASAIAAGIINPVAGRRLVKYPQAEACLEHARSLYADLGHDLGQTFYREQPMTRLFDRPEQQETWAKRKGAKDYQTYLGSRFEREQYSPVPANQFGGFYQHGCGHLDTRGLLAALRKFFRSINCLTERDFSWHHVSTTQDGLKWNGYTIKHVISCEGFRSRNNPYFSWLPYQCSKGEILTLESDRHLPDSMVSNGKWVLPLGGNLLRAGATYQWQTLDSLISTEAEATLRSAAIELLGTGTHLTLHEHVAGVRAGTRDKHPFAGFHPAVTGIGIFGGFGSRGVLTIPYYADCFVQLVLDDNPLPGEIDIARYIDRYATG